MPEPLFQDDEGRNVYSVGEGSSTYTVEELSQNFLEEACSILSETPNPDWSKMGQVSLSWDIELYESKLSDAGYFVDWCDGFVIREALTDEEIAYVDDEGDFGDDQVTEQLEELYEVVRAFGPGNQRPERDWLREADEIRAFLKKLHIKYLEKEYDA